MFPLDCEHPLSSIVGLVLWAAYNIILKPHSLSAISDYQMSSLGHCGISYYADVLFILGILVNPLLFCRGQLVQRFIAAVVFPFPRVYSHSLLVVTMFGKNAIFCYHFSYFCHMSSYEQLLTGVTFTTWISLLGCHYRRCWLYHTDY